MEVLVSAAVRRISLSGVLLPESVGCEMSRMARRLVAG